MSRTKQTSASPLESQTKRSWAEWIAWIATEDHCEWANPYVAWFKTPLGVLAIGAFCSLLCGLFVGPRGYVVLAVIAAVIAVGLAWPSIAVRGVKCRFEFGARRGREGKPTTAKLVVTNHWPWPVWGLAVNDPLLAEERQAAIALARVEGWSTATFNCSLTPSQRGVYPKREIRIGTGFPFGLYQASRGAEVPSRLIVWPQTFWLPPLGSTSSRPHWQGAVNEVRTGSEGTRLGVRDHRVGETLRDVHWAKTARYDRLIVTERESATVEDATVIVETGAQSHSASDGDPALEWRLRIAASICESFTMNHGQVDLWLDGKRLSCGGSPGDLERLLDGVAEFEAGAAPEAKTAAKRIATGVVLAIASCGSSIVLRRLDLDASARLPGTHQPAWIEVTSLDDVPGEVLRGWRFGKKKRVSHAK